jgi:hypothetical protein
VLHVQRGTVQTALGLLTDSQCDIGVTLSMLVDSGSAVDDRLIGLVAQADSRADDVCGLARRLLQLLRSDHATQGRHQQGALWLPGTGTLRITRRKSRLLARVHVCVLRAQDL